jgi:hypothetical protein
MALRKLAAAVPVIAALAIAGPVAGASAQTTAAPGSPGAMIPCYPYPAFCGPNGTPWLQYFQSQLALPTLPALPTNPAFGPGPVQLPGITIP